MADGFHYDGSAGFLVDSNIWIDCTEPASAWHRWSVNQLQACSERAPLHINLIIYAELLVPQPDIRALDNLLDIFGAARSDVPWASAALAAAAYRLYRKRGGVRTRPLPDFFNGAHASLSNLSVLTRDETAYRNYFPRLLRIAP